MTWITPRAVRYALGAFVLLWVALGEIGIFLIGYEILLVFIPSLPNLSPTKIAELVFTPEFFAVFGIAFLGSAVVGIIWYKSLSRFIVAVIKRINDVFKLSLFDEPLVEGRILHKGVAWRCQYWDDDRPEAVVRECPFCGLELVESYLPRHIVLGPNTAFEPGAESRKTADETWHNIFGEETAEDRDEISALSCPQCNFSTPGEKRVLEGRDGARSKFSQHIQKMKSGNSRRNPFAEYARTNQPEGNSTPTPESLWDAYVDECSSDDVLPIGTPMSATQDSDQHSRSLCRLSDSIGARSRTINRDSTDTVDNEEVAGQ